jgi:tetratricopeptide (TPR) repeat protein
MARFAESNRRERPNMSEMSLEQAPQKIRDTFNKGLGALERGSIDLAIEMFLSCLDMEPNLLDVRKFLRAAEIKKFKASKKGLLSHVLSTIAGFPIYTKTILAIRGGKGDQAVRIGEDLLKKDPLNIKFILAFCRAAILAKRPEVAIQTLEMARDSFPSNVRLLGELGRLYLQLNRIGDARECFELVVNLKPNDGAALKALKDSMALESMAKDGWDEAAGSKEEGSFRKMLKDTKEAGVLEAESKAVRTTRDTEALIEESLAKIEREPDNINYYRSLANFYATLKRYDEAIATLKKAQEVRGAMDPEVDATLTTIKLDQFDDEAAQLDAAGDSTGAEAKRLERSNFYFDNIQDRVHRYPNDLHLRYEFGVALFDNDYFTEAIQQFQLSQRNPRHRSRSLYYMGLCFKAKGQHDLAIQQLANAMSEVLSMDATKKDICYQLGILHEELNKPAEAVEYFKQIYQVDIVYKDVAQKVEQLYAKIRGE